MIGIYKITSPSGRVYIGQSFHIENRWSHYRHLHCKDQPRIYNSLKKHGAENHIFEVELEVHNPYFLAPKIKIMDKYEQYFMNKYREMGVELLNIREAASNGKMAQETKDKISAANKGKPKFHLRGIKKSKEAIDKMKIARSNQVFSEADKKKISEGIKRHYDKVGRKEKPISKYARIDGNFSEEQRLRYRKERSGELNHYFGKKHSD